MFAKIKKIINYLIISIYIFLLRVKIIKNTNSEVSVSENGSITVMKTGEAIIPLKKNPREIFVSFVKEEWSPCNPHHHHRHDGLKWKIYHKHPHHKNSDYVLEISWSVRDVRIIKYLIKY